MLLLWWLCTLFWRCPQLTESFVIRVTGGGGVSRWKKLNKVDGFPLGAMNIRRLLERRTSGAGNKKIVPSNSSGTTRELSAALVSLLLLPQENVNDQDRAQTISSLVQQLIDARATFDPKVCLNDNVLYKSHVVNGPIPLWQQLGLFSQSSNLQGQQYNFDEGTIINYAEILGKALHLRAYGTFGREDNNRSTNSLRTNKMMLNLLVPAIGTTGKTNPRCPVNYTVNVDRAAVIALDKRLEIPIRGTGFLRVLYADDTLRIFVSPKSTTDSRWEKAGLLVVQIRADLFDPSVTKLD